MKIDIRYGLIKEKVNNILLTQKINSLPIDVNKIFKFYSNCRIISYSKHMKSFFLSEAEVILHLGSIDGCAVYTPIKNKYLVFYNDLDSIIYSPLRQRWTLAHELGHIALNHHIISNNTTLFRNEISDEEYKWMESEANYFASMLLSPNILLRELDIRSYRDISNICALSNEASNNRFISFKKWLVNGYTNSKDILLMKQFHDFIYKKKCLECNHGFISETAIFCPICGYATLIRGDGKMDYNKLELNGNFQFNLCPECKNGEIDSIALYCKICGHIIKNQCGDIDCKKPAEGNARYCIHCGSKTIFFIKKELILWDDEFEEYERQVYLKSNNLDDDGDIPF